MKKAKLCNKIKFDSILYKPSVHEYIEYKVNLSLTHHINIYKHCTLVPIKHVNLTFTLLNDEGKFNSFCIFMHLVPAVVSFIAHGTDTTADGLTFPEACKRLEEAGADVVGLNCGRGPKTMMPLIKEIRKVCKVLFLLKSID